MKVVLCINSLRNGGAERVMSILANYLSKINYDVTVVTIARAETHYALAPEIKVIELNADKQSKNIVHGLFNFLTRAYKLSRIFLRIRPQGCISFMTETNLISIIAGFITGIPIIVSERTNPKKHATGQTYERLRIWLYKYASSIVLQTTKVKDFYFEELKLNNLETIANPIILEDFQSETHPVDRGKTIVNIGRLSSEKNQLALIDYYANSIAPKTGWKLLIIGEGPLRVQIENKINKLQLNDRVRLLGKIANVNEYLGKAGIFIMVSNYEGFPNALLEGLASGAVCISYDCDFGPSELIEDGVNGFLVMQDDHEGIIGRLNQVIKDPQLRCKLATRGPRSIEPFSHQNIMKKWLALIIKHFSSSQST